LFIFAPFFPSASPPTLWVFAPPQQLRALSYLHVVLPPPKPCLCICDPGVALSLALPSLPFLLKVFLQIWFHCSPDVVLLLCDRGFSPSTIGFASMTCQWWCLLLARLSSSSSQDIISPPSLESARRQHPLLIYFYLARVFLCVISLMTSVVLRILSRPPLSDVSLLSSPPIYLSALALHCFLLWSVPPPL